MKTCLARVSAALPALLVACVMLGGGALAQQNTIGQGVDAPVGTGPAGAAQSDPQQTSAAPIGAQRVDAVVAELVADRDAIAPGARFLVGLRLEHDPQWHTYWRNAGDSGLPTEIDLTLPPGFEAGDIAWPAPHRIAIGPLANYGFEGEIVLPIPVQAPSTLQAGTIRITAHARWLVCREVCIPGEARLALELPAAPDAAAGAAGASRWAPLFARMQQQTPDPQRPVQASWHRTETGIALVFDQPLPARAEYFDYEPGRVRPPAPQTLYVADGRARLDVELQATAPLPEGEVVGLLVADGRPYELRAAPSQAPAPALGAPVAVAEAEPAQARGLAASGPGSGLLGSLLGPSGAGAGSGGGAAADLLAGLPSVSESGAAAGLGIAIVLALVGGLILNLMPCVFPVIGLKVMGFMHDAGGHPARARLHSAVFSLGIVLSFGVLALLMLALRAAGESVGWGFQLQSPPFVAMLALLFVAVGLNFAGVYHIGARLTQLGGISAPTVSGSFGAGVLATVAATPCTAPFMGSAIGYTLERSAPEVLLVFVALGAGMALPYLGLGLSPGLLRWLPRPGAWMESFKQALAFPMFATVAWLAWVLALQVGIDPLLWLLVACTVLAAALWVFGRWQSPSARGIAVALAAAAFWLAWPGQTEPGGQRQASATTSQDAQWERYSDLALAGHVAARRPVFVDFTAAWCISCQVNKKLSLESREVLAAFENLGVVRMRADWTNRDPEITAALARHGRNGVPLYLVYGRSGTVAVLPEVLTPGLVLDALQRAARG